MKISFYVSPTLPHGTPIFCKYETTKDEKYCVDIITKIFYDQPLTLQEILSTNCFINIDISKEFDNELQMKNWLIDKHYNRICCTNEHEIYKIELHQINRSYPTVNNKIDFYAIWNDK